MSRSLPEKPFGERSKIIQPSDSRQSGPEFGLSPRSTGGAPSNGNDFIAMNVSGYQASVPAVLSAVIVRSQRVARMRAR